MRKGSFLTILGLILLIVLLVLVNSVALIFALNVLFGLNIDLNYKTVLASAIIFYTLNNRSNVTYYNKNSNK